MREYSKMKTPYFFRYAKDKELKRVEKLNDSTMNRVARAIKNRRIRFEDEKIADVNMEMLMKQPNRRVNPSTRYDIIELYKKYNSNKNQILKITDEDRKGNSFYINREIRKAIIGSRDVSFVVDTLVEWLFSESNKISKTLFWDCFGYDVAKNIEDNLLKRYGTLDLIYCEICGERVVPINNQHKYCDTCGQELEREQKRRYWHQNKDRYKN